MTSETWVWIHLPGALEAILCGVHRHDGKVGRFVYGKSYLERGDALAIDPVLLPLQQKEFATTHFQGWFSVLLDSGPDAWGRRLIDRNVGPQDQRGYLLHAYGQPVGALTFSAMQDQPPAHIKAASDQSLAHTLALYERLESGGALSADETQELLGQAGTGGARPKLTLADGDALWLVKCESVNDKTDLAPVPLVEAALLSLAEGLHIRVPRHRIETIAGKPVLLVERFDRTSVAGGFARWRYASGQSLLWSAPELAQYSFQGSYTSLASRMRAWEQQPRADVRELYRRIVFNALSGNLDDHEKNHGFVAGADGHFALSQVFDLSVTATVGGRQMLAMPFGAEGAIITRENLLSECEQFGYSKRDASLVIDEQWDELREGLVERLVELGAAEARAASTAALMPGHRLF